MWSAARLGRALFCETVPNFFHNAAGGAPGRLEFGALAVHLPEQFLAVLADEGDVAKVNGNGSVGRTSERGFPYSVKFLDPWTHKPALKPQNRAARIFDKGNS